jgi:hypothetical protein
LDFWDLTVLIFRRWKIALPLLLLTIGGTVLVAMTAKPDYTMTSYVQFIPAKVTATDDPASAALRNPWNQLGLNTLGQASIYATQTQGFLDTLKAQHHTDNFTLTMTYPNPIVSVEVVGKTSEDARETTQIVIDRLQLSAESLQRNARVADSDMIATNRLDQGQNLVPSTSKVKRSILAVAAAGLVMTAGCTVGFDALLRRRARRRAEQETADEPAESSLTAVIPAKGMKPHGSAESVVSLSRSPEVSSPGGSVPTASMERTAIVVRRSASVDKAAGPKVHRSPAATYRSANARSLAGDHGEDAEADHAPANGRGAPANGRGAPANGLSAAANGHVVNGNGRAANGSADKGRGTDGADGSAHANGHAGEPEKAAHQPANGDAAAVPSDVRVVLQPKWVGGENGGKSR